MMKSAKFVVINRVTKCQVYPKIATATLAKCIEYIWNTRDSNLLIKNV